MDKILYYVLIHLRVEVNTQYFSKETEKKKVVN